MGAGCVKEIDIHTKNLGATKSLIVFGKSRNGEKLAEDIKKILENAGLKVVSFAGADPNLTDISVMEGAEIYGKAM